MTSILNYIDPDKIFSNRLAIKVKFVIFLSLICSVFWLFTSTLSILEMILCFYTSVLLMEISVEVGLHRYFAHRAYKTKYWKSRLLLLMGTLSGIGSCLAWVGVHRTHHQHTDKAKDPHSPHNIGLARVWLTLWDDNWIVQPIMVKDLMRDKWQIYFHKNYFKILLSYIFILIMLGWLINSILPLIILFALPTSLTFVLSGITNGLGHLQGYRNFESNDHSYNQHLPRWLLLASGLHNNHHAYPHVWNYNIRQKWYEFDLAGIIIKFFFLQK